MTWKPLTTVALLLGSIAVGGPVMAAEAETDTLSGEILFYDRCTEDWKTHWTLDGHRATIENSDRGMAFSAGPTFGDDACHAVLWTQQRFQGDIKIEYEYTRLDRETRCVTILYVQASGSGETPYVADIAQWADLRHVPAMRIYYNHMNAYHISYAAFDNDNDDPSEDYLRARRYRPLAKQGLQGTDLKPDYARTGLFKTGVPYQITVIKQGQTLSMRVRNDTIDKTFRWHDDTLPPLLEGRIGLRHMHTRAARYRDFRVSRLEGEK